MCFNPSFSTFVQTHVIDLCDSHRKTPWIWLDLSKGGHRANPDFLELRARPLVVTASFSCSRSPRQPRFLKATRAPLGCSCFFFSHPVTAPGTFSWTRSPRQPRFPGATRASTGVQGCGTHSFTTAAFEKTMTNKKYWHARRRKLDASRRA